MTLVFENRDTVRFQIQEMARVEKLLTELFKPFFTKAQIRFFASADLEKAWQWVEEKSEAKGRHDKQGEKQDDKQGKGKGDKNQRQREAAGAR